MYRPSVDRGATEANAEGRVHTAAFFDWLQLDHNPMTIVPLVFSTFDGTAAITQLVNSDDDSDFPPFLRYTEGHFWLDNSEPYCASEPRLNSQSAYQPALRDQPSFPGLSHIGIHKSFRDFVKFRPDAGSAADNIYVTLATFDWHWHAEVAKIGPSWWPSQDDCPAPTFAHSDAFPV